MSRIEQLTAEQIARFPEFVDRWTKIGLCTDSADRPRAEAAIREMYRQGGLQPPHKIVWCGSPLSQTLAFAILHRKLWTQIKARVGSNVAADIRDGVEVSAERGVRDGVKDSVWDSVWDNVIISMQHIVWDSVGDSVQESVFGSVWANVLASVWDGVRDSVTHVWDVGDSIEDSVRDNFASVWDSVPESDIVYGSHDVAILAFHSYFREVSGLTAQTEKLSGLWELAQSAGWMIPCSGICWVSERHHVLQRDDRGRLHCLTGPAVAYPDGFAIYAVHGVRVPDYVVELSREIDVASIDAQANAEVRRVMIELYRHGEEVSGAAAFMRDAGARRLDHDERYRTLWRRDVEGDEPIVMVEMISATSGSDGSRKHNWLRVPPQMLTAREAVAWIFRMSPQEYAPAIETGSSLVSDGGPNAAT